MTPPKPTNGKLPALWEILKVTAVPLAFALGGFLFGHEIRISKIEETRFTDQDAAEMYRELLENLPPQWLKDTIKELQKHCRATEIQISDLNARVQSLERK